MSVSDRYRDIVEDVHTLLKGFQSPTEGDEAKVERVVAKADADLGELAESVGEIPRIRLESQLTPVLLRAHSHLDRARLLLEEQGAEDRAAAVWDLEQKIYRLLNDL